MVCFADMKIKDLSDETKVSAKSVNVVIGYAMGYAYDGGVWYTDSTLATPVTGVMKSLAPKTVGELNDITHTMTVGEVMGYEKVGGVWYSTYVAPDDPGNVEASGVIGAICDSYVDTLSNDIEEMQLGKVLFQFLPADVLAEPAREALTGKTLKEVVELKMTDLLTGIKLGYVAGVQYEKDSSGRYLPVYKDPAKPTLLELLGSLDLGKTLDVVGNGGDMLAVINDGMNDVMIDLLIKSVSSDDNATLNGIVAGKTIGDLIVEDETTGALSLDVGVLINGRKFGDLMGYTR